MALFQTKHHQSAAPKMKVILWLVSMMVTNHCYVITSEHLLSKIIIGVGATDDTKISV